MSERKKLRLTVIAIKEGRRCRHGHKVGDVYVLCESAVEGLCARNRKSLLQKMNELADGSVFTCPDRAVTFEVAGVE